MKCSRTLRFLCLDTASEILSYFFFCKELQESVRLYSTPLMKAIFRVNFQVWKCWEEVGTQLPFVCHISPCWGKQTAGNCRTHLSVAAVWCSQALIVNGAICFGFGNKGRRLSRAGGAGDMLHACELPAVRKRIHEQEIGTKGGCTLGKWQPPVGK